MAQIALPLPRRLSPRAVNPPRFGFGGSALVVSWIGMALLFATAALSVYLVQISAVANAGYDLQRLEAERKGWIARNEQLELELAKRRSLAWVEAQAVQRLGMVRADKAVYIPVGGHANEEAPGEAAARSTPRAAVSEAPRPEARPARPEPGNPAWAVESVQAWLAVAARR